MKRVLWAIVLLCAFVVAAMPGTARAAADCAFQDVNDNGLFDVGTDIVVTDVQWLNGTAFVSNYPFVVPSGCVLPDLNVLKAPLFGVKVTATKITWLGSLTYNPPGGKGIVLIADPAQVPAAVIGDGSVNIGDGVTSNVKIEAGGVNALPATTFAVAQKAVAIVGTGICNIQKASLIGNRPIQDTRVGVLCTGDLTIRDALIKGSRVNIQSLQGKIDARSFAPPPGANLAHACDDPALNILAGGNNNGVLDAGDFPCQINLAAVGSPPGTSPVFNTPAQLLAFCQDPALAGVNRFQAFNDPLIMIAKLGLDLHGIDGGETELLGKYRVTLVSETGDINTAHTFVNHGVPQPGGAKIWLFAKPFSVVRLPVDHEDMFGPSSGSTDVTSACFESPSPVQVGKDAANNINLIGVPDGPPCKQLGGGFVPVLNGLF